MSELRVIALFYINYVNDGDACLTSYYSIISLRVAFSMENFSRRNASHVFVAALHFFGQNRQL